ncbi:MAG: hypothetical protein FJZ95_09525 [Chloroflexi bacterium]|nr:hypothetical protein [Chloroflexota bacterium]
MAKKFEHILDECLDRMAGGEAIEKCLADHPEHAAELRPLLESAAMVREKSASLEPRPEFRSQAKQRLLAQVRAGAEAQPERKRFAIFEWHYRWAVAVAAVLLVLLIGGSTTVVASTNAMPDDFLYPVKIRVEKVRLAFAGSDTAKAKLQADFAERRAEELAKMAEKGKWGKVEQAAERLANHLEKISNIAARKRLTGKISQEDVARLTDTLAAYAAEHPMIFKRALEKMPPENKAIIVRLLERSQARLVEAVQDLNIAARLKANGLQSVEGLIRIMRGDKWLVGRDVVRIDENTIIEGTPLLGRFALVWVTKESDGSLLAQRIVLNVQ